MDNTMEPMEVDEWEPCEVETEADAGKANDAIFAEKGDTDFDDKNATLSQSVTVEESDGHTEAPQAVTEDSDSTEIVPLIERDVEAANVPAIVEVVEAPDNNIEVVASAGDDVDVVASAGDDVDVVASTGDDVDVMASAGDDVEVVASDADDVEVVASAGDEAEVMASAGDETEVMASAGDDVEVIASAGDDVEVVASADDEVEVVASAGDDIEIMASADNDVDVVASAGDETEVIASAGDDVEVVASVGDDVEVVASADDEVEVMASAGDETEVMAAAGDETEVMAAAGDETEVVASVGDDVEVVASAGDDVEVAASAGDETEVMAAAGDETEVMAAAGDETEVVASVGDDVEVVASAGDDVEVVASAGDDVEVAASAGDDVEVAASAGDDVDVESAKDNAKITCDSGGVDAIEAADSSVNVVHIIDDDVEVIVTPASGDVMEVVDDNLETVKTNEKQVELIGGGDDVTLLDSDQDVTIVESADKEIEILGDSNRIERRTSNGSRVNDQSGVVVLDLVDDEGKKCSNLCSDSSGVMQHEYNSSENSLERCSDCKKVMSKAEYASHSETCEVTSQYKTLWARCRDLSPDRSTTIDHGLRGLWSESWRESTIHVKYKKTKFATKIGENFYKLEVPGMAKCILCQKQIWYGGRGKRALKDHIKSKEHLNKMMDYHVRGQSAKQRIDQEIRKLTAAIMKTRGLGSLNNSRGKLFDCIHCGLPFSASIVTSHESRCVEETKKAFQLKKKAFGLRQLLVVDDESANQSDIENRIKELSTFLTNEEKAYICVICKTSFNRESRKRFMEHCLKHKNQVYACNICSQEFVLTRKYQRHILHHAMANAKGCQVCGQPVWHMRNAQNKIYWLVRKHDCIYEPPEPEKSDQPFKCKLCNGKELKTQSAAMMHAYLHVASSPFPCDQCDLKFATRTDRVLHKNKEHNVHYPSGHRCKLCMATFNNLDRLRTHDEICTDMVTSYRCELCNVVYKASSVLTKHVRTIHGDTPKSNDAKRRRLDANKKSEASSLIMDMLNKPITQNTTIGTFNQKSVADQQLLRMYEKAGTKVMTCPLCCAFYTVEADKLKDHITDLHIGRETIEALGANAFKQCFFCNRWCTNFPNLITHMTAAHSKGVVRGDEGLQAVCLICHEKTDNMYLHVKANHTKSDNPTNSESDFSSKVVKKKALCCPFCLTCMREHEAIKKHIAKEHVGEDVIEKLGERAFKFCFFCPVNCRNLHNWLNHLFCSHRSVDLSQMKFDGVYFKKIESTDSNNEVAVSNTNFDPNSILGQLLLEPSTLYPAQSKDTDEVMELVHVDSSSDVELIQVDVAPDVAKSTVQTSVNAKEGSVSDSDTVVIGGKDKVTVGNEQFVDSRPADVATLASPTSQSEKKTRAFAVEDEQEREKEDASMVKHLPSPNDSMDVDKEHCESGDPKTSSDNVHPDNSSASDRSNTENVRLNQHPDYEEESVSDSVTLITQEKDGVAAGSGLIGDSRPNDVAISLPPASQPQNNTRVDADNEHESGTKDTSIMNSPQPEGDMEVDQGEFEKEVNPNRLSDNVHPDNSSTSDRSNTENVCLNQHPDYEEESVSDSVTLITQEKDGVAAGSGLIGDSRPNDVAISLPPASQSQNNTRVDADNEHESGTKDTSIMNSPQPEGDMEVDQGEFEKEVNPNRLNDNVHPDNSSTSDRSNTENVRLNQHPDYDEGSVSDSVTLITQEKDGVVAGSGLIGDSRPNDVAISLPPASQPQNNTRVDADNNHESGTKDTSIMNSPQPEGDMDVDQGEFEKEVNPNRLSDNAQCDNSSTGDRSNTENVCLTQVSGWNL